MLRNCLSLRMDSTFHGSIFVSRPSAEAEHGGLKETGGETAPVPHRTETEFVAVEENHSRLESFTQDDVHISDADGQSCRPGFPLPLLIYN